MRNVSTTWNSWKVKNLWTCLLQHGNLQYHDQYTIRLTFIIFTSTYYTCLLTRMCWNAWILVFEGFFQLLHLLVGGRAAVAPDCTIGQSASLQFWKVLAFPRTVMTMQVTGIILTIQKVKPNLALFFIYLKLKKLIKWKVIFQLPKILQYF